MMDFNCGLLDLNCGLSLAVQLKACGNSAEQRAAAAAVGAPRSTRARRRRCAAGVERESKENRQANRQANRDQIREEIREEIRKKMRFCEAIEWGFDRFLGFDGPCKLPKGAAAVPAPASAWGP